MTEYIDKYAVATFVEEIMLIVDVNPPASMIACTILTQLFIRIKQHTFVYNIERQIRL